MPGQNNMINDVGTLLKIPSKVTTEIVDKSCLCIGNMIYEAKAKGETQTSINIGIGTLSINLIDMQCKFIPSKSLKTAIKQSLTAPVDPLELVLAQAFADKLQALCEEVL